MPECNRVHCMEDLALTSSRDDAHSWYKWKTFCSSLVVFFFVGFFYEIVNVGEKPNSVKSKA